MKPPIPIEEELGCSPTFNYQFFDPLNLANEYNFAMYREAELKHGRIAMLATLGNLWPDLLRDQITPPPSVYLSPSNELHFRDVPTGLKALSVVPLWGWFQIVLFIAFLETQVLVQRDKKDLPGDYGVGYFGLRDKAKHWRYSNLFFTSLCSSKFLFSSCILKFLNSCFSLHLHKKKYTTDRD